MAFRSSIPSARGRWKAFRPEISPVPPARLLITAVATASSKSLAPDAATVNQPRPSHKAVGHLGAAEIDRVVAREIRVNALVELAVTRIAHVERFIAAVIFRKLLLDDVGFDRDAQMNCLSRQIRRYVIILVFFESAIAQIAPQNGG